MTVGIIYETLCRPTGMRYRGKHKCRSAKTLDRHYIGTGKLLKDDIERYGKDAFARTVLLICDPKWLDYYEAGMVDDKWAERADTYNVDVGGKGSNRPEFLRNPHRKHNHANWLDYLKNKVPVKMPEEFPSQEAMIKSLEGKWFVVVDSFSGCDFYVSPDDETNIWFYATSFYTEEDAIATADMLNKKSFGREWHDSEWYALKNTPGLFS